MGHVHLLVENPDHNAPFVRCPASENAKTEYPCFHFLICEEPVAMLLAHWAAWGMEG